MYEHLAGFKVGAIKMYEIQQRRGGVIILLLKWMH